MDILNKKNVEYSLNDFKENINGRATHYHISPQLVLMELDFQTPECITLKLDSNHSNYLQFMYNLKGDFSISIPGTPSKKLDSFQSAIVLDKMERNVYLKFNKNVRYQVCIIKLLKYNGNNKKDEIFDEFEKIRKERHNGDSFIDIGLPNLQICDQVRKLLALPKENLSNNFLAAGYINILLGIKLKTFLEDKPRVCGTLTSREIQIIQDVSDKILENPEQMYTLNKLCLESGLSVNKLQEGFKEMHGTTVSNFITDMRLKKAEEMIISTDLNISEIVYSIGLTSRSYFCRIFKQKYHCTPKTYQQNTNPLAVTA